MIRKSVSGLGLAAALLAAACGGGDGPSGPSGPVMGLVVMGNHSNVPIIEVNISACSESSWGANRLQGGEVIAPGATRSFEVTPGCYDFRANTASKSGKWYDRNVHAGATVNVALSAAANEAPAGFAK